MRPAYWRIASSSTLASMSRSGLFCSLLSLLQLCGCGSTRTTPSNELPLADREGEVPSTPLAAAPEPVASSAAQSTSEPATQAGPAPQPKPKPEPGTTLPTYAEAFSPSYHPARVAGKDGYFLLHDFSKRGGSGSSLNGIQSGLLVARFPHPKAKPGTTCRANDPNEPTKTVEEPFTSAIAGSFSSAGAKEVAFFIDYCPTGLGQPRTRRVVVIDGDKLVIDYVLPATARGEWADLAIDVDGDGREEILATSIIWRPDRPTVTEATLLRLAPKPAVLGAWKVIDHCDQFKKNPDTTTTHTISWRMKDGVASFRDVAKTEGCFYPPAPPS
jgi:hypothetical protein